MKPSLSASCVAVALGATVLLAGCERPPVDTVQRGYRGTGMVHVENPRLVQASVDASQPPEDLPPAVPGTPAAKTVYQNVQVVGDLSVADFTRLMASMATWVAPEQGCNYCHVAENYAADTLYTKVVARRMLQMTKHINADWHSHVANTGVTCYTCHRGNPVPSYAWFTDPGPSQAGGAARGRAGFSAPNAINAYASLPGDPLTAFLKDPNDAQQIRVNAEKALPGPTTRAVGIQNAEWTYSLMMHMSRSLGVNCTYCHNSRQFASWEQSSPQRVTAWYGIRMVRNLNQEYMEPLTQTFPLEHRGPLGDVGKVNCMTCHQGAFKPLYGVPMLANHPELGPNYSSSPSAPPAAADATPAPAPTPPASPPASDKRASAAPRSSVN